MNLNIDLIDEIIATINPDNFDMGHWGSNYEGVKDPNHCGTTCCIAGWARVLDAKPGRGQKVAFTNLVSDPDSTARIARKKLGLPTNADAYLGFDEVPLFFDTQWPDHYQVRLSEEGEAEVAADLLTDIKAGAVVYDESIDSPWWAQFATKTPVGV